MNVPHELETLRDWLRYAVSRFNEAGLAFGHGTPTRTTRPRTCCCMRCICRSTASSRSSMRA